MPPLPRSPELMSRHDTALLVVDVQTKLMPLVQRGQAIIDNIARLIRAARLLHVPVLATEQYPQGLGPTVPELAALLDAPPAKRAFSCGECGETFEALLARDVHKVLVTGIEAHVCVQQTVFDLMTAGFRVYVAVDAIGSRYEIDYQTALRRMDSGGATLTTAEAAMFEWCETSAAPEFKQLSQLVQQRGAE